MAQFKNKPVTVDAIQFTGENKAEIESFVGKSLVSFYGGLQIPYLQSSMVANAGDWIVKDGDVFYPVDDATFNKNFEPITA